MAGWLVVLLHHILEVLGLSFRQETGCPDFCLSWFTLSFQANAERVL